MDTKKFTIIVASLTVVVCIITVVFNFASMPSYSDSSVSAVPLYNNTAMENEDLDDEDVPESDGTSAEPSQNSEKRTSSNKSSSQKSSSSQKAAASSGKTKTSNTAKEKATEQNPVNINTADLSKLESIPYVGATHAQAILDYRNAHGNFATVDDLDNVKGFGAKTIEKIRKFITVG